MGFLIWIIFGTFTFAAVFYKERGNKFTLKAWLNIWLVCLFLGVIGFIIAAPWALIFKDLEETKGL